MIWKIEKRKKRKDYTITLLWIGLIISLAGLVATLVINGIKLTEYVKYSLTGMVIGFLLIFLTLLLRRLRKMGIDYFVTGAIIAYLGFLLVAFPALAYTLQLQIITQQYYYIIMLVSGLILIIFGFFAETYDLNRKILKLMISIKDATLRLLTKINWKLVLSPFNILTIAGITLIFLTYYKVIPEAAKYGGYYYAGAASLIVLNLILLFREEIGIILINLSRIMLTVLQALIRELKQIPTIVVKLARWIGKTSAKIIKWTAKAIKYAIIHNYILLFGIGIGLFFVTKSYPLEARVSLSAFVCLISLVKPLVDQRERIGEQLGRARTYAYKLTRMPKRIVRRKIICPYCQSKINANAKFCPRCGRQTITCYVCSMLVSAGEKGAMCPNCGNIFHSNHLKTWVSLRKTCPICKKPINKIEEHAVRELI